MYLCICNAITEDEFTEILKEETMGQALLRTGAGNCCGQCIERIEEIDKELDSSKKLLTPRLPLTRSHC